MSKKNKRKIARSGNAHCEICEKPNVLEIHHLRGRDVPNPHKPWNVVVICANCHSDIHLPYGHQNKIVVEGWFETSRGKNLIWRKESEPSITGEICDPPSSGEKNKNAL